MKTMVHYSFPRFIPAVSVVAFAAFSPLALAQTQPPPQNLTNLPGLTPLQQPGAKNVQDVCTALGLAGVPPPTTSGPTGTGSERLFYSCRVLVQTANQLAGVPVAPFSLGIQNPDLRTGVQASEPVQMNAQKQITAEGAKMNLLGARLLDLRGGSRGFVVGVNHQDGSGEASASERLAHATGGAASADDVSGRWGGFINFGYNWGDVDQTLLQDAYSYNSYNLLAGADYRISDELIVGGAVSYSDTKSDFEQSLGNIKARTWSFAGYGTYYRDSWFIDALVAYGSIGYDTTRNILIPSSNPSIQPFNTSATASPDGVQWSASIGIGRNFDYDSVTITPTARLNYIWVKNKAFDETEPINGMGLHVDDRTIDSLQSALGAKFSTVVSTANGVFGPYFQAQWIHEFRNDATSILSKFVFSPINNAFFIPTADPTRDYAVLAVGSSATFPNNFSGFVQFSAALGLQDQTAYGVVVGVRKQF